MARIGTVGRVGAAPRVPAGDMRPARDAPAADAVRVPGRALVVVEGGRRAEPAPRALDGRPEAGFLAQLLVSADPSLRPARLERTRAAAALYAEAARRAG